MAIRVGINGFGRIGRAFLRITQGRDDIEIVAINDLGSAEDLAYLLKFDSVYKAFPGDVHVQGQMLVVNGKEIALLSESDPSKLPWGPMNIDVAVESTGAFTTYDKAHMHIVAGAKRVVISAPSKGEGAETILMGLNEEKISSSDVTSNASCTTNAASPLIAILDEALGIERALLNTTHAYTATQAIVDGPDKKHDMRSGRAAAINMIPSSTGAAIAVTQAYPSLVGKFDGISIRVPVMAGSIADITFIAGRDTTTDEVNDILRKAAASSRWQGIFAITDEPVVSSDMIGNLHASIADLSMTRVIGNLVKVLAWYDNEMGYANMLVRHVVASGSNAR